MADHRPKADLPEIEKLLGTDKEIASVSGVNTNTVGRRRKVLEFSDVNRGGESQGPVSDRRKPVSPRR